MNFTKPKHLLTAIKTFNDVNLNNVSKPLVICDIDHTFIRCSYGLDHFRKILNDDVNNLPNIATTNLDLDKEAIDLMNTAYNMGFVKQTDPNGFKNMLQKIEQNGGKLIFLTARGIISHEKTIKDFRRAGFENPENFDIHYTNNEMTKGEYIKKTNLTDGYEHISFIDDYPSFIASVHHHFPNIQCYLFYYD